MAEQLGPFIGAGREFKDLLSISQFINQGVGGTALLFAVKPSGSVKVLIVAVHTDAVRIRVGDYRARDFVDGDVSVGADTLTLTGETAFGVAAGEVVPDPYKLTTTVALPAGLDLTTIYILRVISIGPDVVALYTNDADARADTNRVDITAAAGGGTHTIGGMPVQAVATIQDGYGVLEIPGSVASGPIVYKFAAPDRVTMIGTGTGPLYNYYWI